MWIARPFAAGALACLVACGGSSSPPPPPGHAPVIASFTASPSWVTTGQTASLNWSVTDATSLSINTIGAVSGTGTTVTPAADATYVLTANNSYGSTEAQVELPVFGAPTTWFAPLGATSAIPVQGAADYFDLFSPTAPWSNAAGHVTVFKMYSQMLNLDDTTLRNMFANLKSRHIAFAIEWGPLDEPNRCGIGEGFDGTSALQVAQRIRDLGGSLQYIAFDEPFSGAALYQGAGACHWTPEQTAQNGAKNLALIQSVFPDVVAGDIEVVPNLAATDTWLEAYEQWIDAWQAVTGKPLAFFHFDMDWGSDWKPAATALSRALAARHIPVGHIYNGDDGASDTAWMTLAEQHMTDFETHAALVPDQAIFQSWQAYPKHLLPETDPTAFTYLINRYFRARTHLTLSNVDLTPSSPSWTATLTTGSGPIVGATLSLTAVPVSGDSQSHAYSLSGVIPPGTQYIQFGARVGMEQCSRVPLPADFLLTDFTLNAGAAGGVHEDFTNGLTGWGVWGNAATAQVQGTQFHAQVLAGQTLGLNSVPLPFTAAGDAYTFTANATIPSTAQGNGCIGPIFLDQTQAEITRTSLQIAPLPLSLQSGVTDTNGALQVNPGVQAVPAQVWAEFAGTSAQWPAASSQLVPSPTLTPTPLAITTISLPDATTGTAYAQQLNASGGMPGYLWASAALPPGLTLDQNGLIAGTSTKAGSYTILVSVVDGSTPNQVVDASFQLLVH